MSTNVLLDLKTALRSYLKRPAFTAAAVLMLALGIGANTAIFSVAYGVLLKPLSYPQPERLVSLWPETAADKMIADAVARRTTAFSGVSAYAGRNFPLTGEGEPEIVKGAQVGAAHFSVLGARPMLGRAFTAGEGSAGRDQVAVLGYGLWKSRYGGDRRILGRSIQIDGKPFQVIGVMPASFQPLAPDWQLWTPLVIDPANEADYLGSFYLEVVARLKPGVSAEQAQAQLTTLAAALKTEHPNVMIEEKVEGATLVPLHESLVGEVRSTLLVLLSAVGVVLLIACGNVANLLLAHATARRREMAVRTALGAGPWRLIRYVFTESLLLAAIGGVAGLAVAALTIRLLLALLPDDLPRATEIGLDGSVLGFALGISVASAVLFGIAPARRAVRPDLVSELRQESAGGSLGRAGRRSGQGLVVMQVAAAMVLLVAAGVMLKSLGRLQAVDPGFRPDGVLSARVDLVESRYPEAAGKIDYYRRVTERIAALPGVRQVGAIHLLPLTPDNWSFPYLAEGHELPANAPGVTTLPNADFRVVTPGYFRTMGIRVLRGRDFAATDEAESAPVGLINRTMAEELWPGADPVGKSVQMFGNGGPKFTVVGVVDDVHEHTLNAEPKPAMYRPFTQWPNASMYLMVRAGVPPESLAGAVRRAVWNVDPQVPVSEVRPMQAVVRTSVADERLSALLIAAFATLAVLLAASGAYSVISYAVARRTRELGIRIALGAQRSTVFRHVMKEGLVLTAAGLVLGTATALLATRVLVSRLYGVSPADPGAFAISAVLIAATALGSYWIPAWRATRVDPLLSLKSE